MRNTLAYDRFDGIGGRAIRGMSRMGCATPDYSVHRGAQRWAGTGGTAIDTNERRVGSERAGESAPGRPVGYRRRPRSVLRIRPFRRLWLVLGVASFGDWLGLLATSIFAAAQVQRRAPPRALAFGGVIAVRLLPALVLGPVAGVLADRFDRRYTMVICDLLRFVLFASIPLVALLGASGAAGRRLGGRSPPS